MGVLKKITNEYFGEMMRKEDMTVSTVLRNCIINKDREKFLTYFNGLDKRNRFVVYDKDETMTGGALIMTETEAHNYLYNEFTKHNFKARCVSIDNLLTKPKEYENYVDCWDKLPDNTKPVFDNIFGLCYDSPEYVSTFIALHLTLGSRRTVNVLPGDIEMVNALDIYKPSVFENDPSLGEECFVVIIPDGYTHLLAHKTFTEVVTVYVDELVRRFGDSGYKCMEEIPGSIERKYVGVFDRVFVKIK